MSDSDNLKAGHVLRFSGEVVLPCPATFSEACEWLEFETGANGSMSCGNPLSRFGIEVDRGLDVEDRGIIRVYEKYDEVNHGDGRREWKTRRIETRA